METHFVETNGIRLNVLQGGPEDGQLVILLHGFPELSYGWHNQIPNLAAAGYRVWAPDQRGVNLSDKPDGIGAYTLDLMAADVVGLIDAAGREQAVLVGHDWGAGVAWWVAAAYPERVAKLVILNLPHITVFLESLKSSFKQNLKSWYRYFFQIPWLPEYLLKLWNWKMMEYSLTSSSHHGTFTEKELAIYKEAWSQPKAIQSMLNTYRAVVQRPLKPLENPRISMPTLLIWGTQDTYLLRELAEESMELCDDGRLEYIDGATHWVHHEAAERVNELMVSFLGESVSE